jgi:hypothetical protein
MSATRFLRKLSLRNSSPQRAAYLAALGLVGIQVGIGVIMKTAQSGGSYAFSPSGSITISEFLKLILSSIFFYRECKTRAQTGVGPSTRGSDTAYASLADDHQDLEIQDKDEDSSSLTALDSEDEGSRDSGPSSPPLPFGLRTFWSYIRGEVRDDVRFGFYNLALIYILINNSVSTSCRFVYV